MSMAEYEPGSGYNLPPGCYDSDPNAPWNQADEPTCGGCSHLLDGCCDYGICELEFEEAFGGGATVRKAVGNGSEVSAAELGRFDFYEIKSCMGDFTSGHGLNFWGDTNILVCERELANELYRRRMFPANCDKVLCPNRTHSTLVTAYEPNMGGSGSNRRRYPASHLLLCMMSRMGSQFPRIAFASRERAEVRRRVGADEGGGADE